VLHRRAEGSKEDGEALFFGGARHGEAVEMERYRTCVAIGATPELGMTGSAQRANGS